MSTTRFLCTALPHSLADDATFHVSVFVTHRLVPEAPDATLGTFPAAAGWVATLTTGTLRLLASNAPGGIATRRVSKPSATAWVAVFPPDTPVEGFRTPDVSEADWVSYPADSVGEHALQLHHASALGAPLTPPGLADNPALEGIWSTYRELMPGVRELLGPHSGQKAERDAALLRQKTSAALATLGGKRRGEDGYASTAEPWTSAIEILLDPEHSGDDERLTAYLDGLVEAGERPDDPSLRALVDAHATRRFYQREQTDYAAEPTEDATTPRPEPPVPDFHDRAASFGSTPVLLRRLGLVVDVAVDDPGDRALLAKSRWIAAELEPAPGVDAVRQAPPRTWCESDGERFQAVSTNAWSGGALPLGDPDRFVVLDLDPDASGLKLEQHLRTLPRTLASELNGDPASGSPASLRATGFSVARVDRVDATRSQVTRAEGFEAVDDGPGVQGPDLVYDDVVRGLRLEVWDDRTEQWHSLHERRVDVTAGGTPVLADELDVGFLQLSGLNSVPGETDTYYLHQVLAGWDGWSLSAPRPGKVIVHGDGVNGPAGEELVLDEPPDDPHTHVHIRSRVAPGTLPWLRFGWEYSFRIRGVDLAGNAVPLPPPPAPADADAVTIAAGRQLSRLRRAYAARDASGLLSGVRQAVLDRLPPPDPGRDLVEVIGEVGDALTKAQERVAREAHLPSARTRVQIPAAARTGVKDVDDILRARLAARSDARATSPAQVDRDTVAVAVAALARSQDTWRARPNLDVDPERFARVIDRVGSGRLSPGAIKVPGVELPPPPTGAPATAPVVTTPRPFLRWSPVPPPTFVPVHGYQPGESAHRLVIRHGVPSERHVVPPKTSQLEAEQHGCFDDAIGSPDPDVHATLYPTALKERGTLQDEWIPSSADANVTVQQPGIELAARPGANPATLVTLADITAERDTPLGEGQYVVHDTPRLVLPYLPDPLAVGVALVFYDAGDPHVLPEPRVLQTVVLPYDLDEEWPDLVPLRLVVEPGPTLGARREGHVVHIAVPPGEQVRVAVSSSLTADGLEVMGMWRTHLASQPGVDPAVRAVLADAAARGWCWWLTPSIDARLVHAVPRPVHPPEIEALKVVVRPPGLPVAALAGVVDVHGPSTERLVVQASWEEWVDDITADAPARVARQDVVTSSPVQVDERFGLLHLFDAVIPGVAGGEPVVSHRAIQTFADTHHRRVSYAARGVTRYAEFFEPAELPADSDPTLLGAPVELTVASSARPAAPEVTDVIPLLTWDTETEPDHPFALRRRRRSGVRIWLDRPWYSSGDGELLGVVLGGTDVPATSASAWAKEPTMVTGTPPSTRVLPLVTAAELVRELVAGEVVDEQPDRPVLPPAPIGLVDLEGAPTATVVGYRPEYHPGRRQWFVDVAMDPGKAVWPFVRLAVARYQPDSITGCHLSPVVMTDWAQPLPERLATVSRPDAGGVRVTLTGHIALSRFPRRGSVTTPATDLDAVLALSREVLATVQRRPGGEATGDLAWEDVVRVRVPLVGLDPESQLVTWSAGVPLDDLDEPVEVATPGTSETVRVLIEEVEHLDADPDTGPKTGTPGVADRVVYADAIPL